MIRWISPKFIIRVGRLVLGFAILAGVALTLFIPVRIVLPASGTIKGETVLVSAPFRAPIKKILAHAGARVSAGDPLLILDTTAIYNQTRTLQSKIDTGWIAIPLPGDDQIRSRIQNLEENLKNSVIRAPVDGIVEPFVFLEAGRMVMDDRPILRIHRPDSMIVEAAVPENGFKAYETGSPVSIKDIFGRHYAGKVIFRGDAVIRSSRDYESHIPCLVSFTDSADLPIGSEVSLEAVYYKGSMLGLIWAEKPEGAVFRFGR